MISTNRFVVFLRDEYEWRGAWEEGRHLFGFHFVLGSDRRSVSDGDASALCLAVPTRWEVLPRARGRHTAGTNQPDEGADLIWMRRRRDFGINLVQRRQTRSFFLNLQGRSC